MIHARSRHTWALLTAGVLTLVVGLTAGGVASAQTTSLTVGSKDFSGAQAISQAYGQALENKGDDITFKDNLGATEIVYKALENGDLDGYADYQGTLLTYLGGGRRRTPPRRTRPSRRSSPAPASWRASRRPRST